MVILLGEEIYNHCMHMLVGGKGAKVLSIPAVVMLCGVSYRFHQRGSSEMLKL